MSRKSIPNGGVEPPNKGVCDVSSLWRKIGSFGKQVNRGKVRSLRKLPKCGKLGDSIMSIDVGSKVKHQAPSKWGVVTVGVVVQFADCLRQQAIVGYRDCVGRVRYITVNSKNLQVAS